MPKPSELSFTEMFDEVKIWYAGLAPAERSQVRRALAAAGFSLPVQPTDRPQPAKPKPRCGHLSTAPKPKPRMWREFEDGRIEEVL